MAKILMSTKVTPLAMVAHPLGRAVLKGPDFFFVKDHP